jgi:hypothetical protein
MTDATALSASSTSSSDSRVHRVPSSSASMGSVDVVVGGVVAVVVVVEVASSPSGPVDVVEGDPDAPAVVTVVACHGSVLAVAPSIAQSPIVPFSTAGRPGTWPVACWVGTCRSALYGSVSSPSGSVNRVVYGASR